MKVILVVHGFVQGIGYRWFVKKEADRYGIRGMVRNAPDGSVEIVADGAEEAVGRFRKAIEVYMENGPQVTQIEEHAADSGRVRGRKDAYEEFVIEK